MKIYSDRRSDLVKERDEYLADKSKRQSRYDSQDKAYREARFNIEENIKSNLMEQLSKFRALDFRVLVMTYDNIEVMITCNENSKFDNDVALAWSMKFELNQDGDVVKNSNSWSGLKATTPEQIESLSQTLDAIKYLNSVDWDVILHTETPKYEDYFDMENPTYEKPPKDFDRELLEIDVEDSTGKDVLIPIDRGAGKYYRGEVYLSVISMTPSRIKVFEVPKANLDTWERHRGDEYQISKDKFYSIIDKDTSHWIYN